MGRSKKRKQESKTEHVYTSYRNGLHNKTRYEKKAFVHNDFARWGYKDIHMCSSRGYKAYSWYKPSRNFSAGKPLKKNSHKKIPSRPSSPVLGSEEYMVRKIQKTSAIIMKQLLNPNEQAVVTNDKDISKTTVKSSTDDTYEQNIKSLEKVTELDGSKSKGKKLTTYNIEEIQKKIMNHITNLNDGKKKNLINCNNSGYDTVIQHIQKQKRLEISRALRDMCSQSSQTQESSDFINSIIPDIGIKIEDLPYDVIEQLTNTLNLDFERQNFDKELASDFSLDTGYFSIVESQQAEENILNQNNSRENEQSPSENRPESIGDHHEFMPHKNICFESESHTEVAPEQNDAFSLALQNNNESSKNEQLHFESYIKPEPQVETDCSETEQLHSKTLFVENNQPHSEIVVKLEPIDDPLLSQQDNLRDGQLPSGISLNLEPHTDSSLSVQESGENGVNEESSLKNFDTHSSGCNEDTPLEECIDNENQYIKVEETKEGINLSVRTASYHENTQSSIANLQGGSSNSSISLEEIDSKMVIDGPEIVQNYDGNIVDEKFNQAEVYNSIPQNLNVSTQTEEISVDTAEAFVDLFLASSFKQPVETISETINVMLKIDECISKLTEYRQSLFKKFNSKDNCSSPEKTIGRPSIVVCTTRKGKKKNRKRKKENVNTKEIVKYHVNDLENGLDKKRKSEATEADENKNTSEARNNQNQNKEDNFITCDISANEINQQNLLEFQEVQEKMLVLKIVEDKLVAATESGKIFLCSLEDGHYIKVLEASKMPITSLMFLKVDSKKIEMYIGSFEANLKIYNFHSQALMKCININEGIQCMESNWGFIFIGCNRGSVLRYSLKKGIVEYEDRFSDNEILALKATQEGARRILVIGSRNSPVCVRDAMTGLYMRTMEDTIFPTVFSMVIEKNIVYCGTANHGVLVFSFHNGKLLNKLIAADSASITCLGIVQNLLFASSHNGSIYIYDIHKNVFISSLKGPGGGILSMEVLKNQVIVGTMSCKFKSIQIPHYVLKLQDKY